MGIKERIHIVRSRGGLQFMIQKKCELKISRIKVLV